MRYPNLTPIDQTPPSSLGLDGRSLADARRVARAVCSRTGCRAWFNSATGSVLFGYEHADGFVAGIGLPTQVTRLFRDPNRSVYWPFSPIENRGEDQIVNLIQLAKVDPETKDRWAKAHAAEQKDLDDAETARQLDDQYREAASIAQHEYDKHSMGKHYRRSVSAS